VPSTSDLTKVLVPAGREKFLEEVVLYTERVAPVTALPVPLNNLQAVLPSAKTPMEVRLYVPVGVVARETEALGLESKNWATVPNEPTLKLTPMVALLKDMVIVSAIVFSLNDMFEFEEFDIPPP
jgi:hypothetical protein